MLHFGVCVACTVFSFTGRKQQPAEGVGQHSYPLVSSGIFILPSSGDDYFAGTVSRVSCILPLL